MVLIWKGHRHVERRWVRSGASNSWGGSMYRRDITRRMAADNASNEFMLTRGFTLGRTSRPGIGVLGYFALVPGIPPIGRKPFVRCVGSVLLADSTGIGASDNSTPQRLDVCSTLLQSVEGEVVGVRHHALSSHWYLNYRPERCASARDAFLRLEDPGPLAGWACAAQRDPEAEH
jgi:hypothetical protein